MNWTAANQLASKITTNTKLREFQFKLLHRRLPTSDFLTKIQIQENPRCFFCKEEKEKLTHVPFFWSCPKIKSFWEYVIVRLKSFQVVQNDFSLDISLAIGLRPASSKLNQQAD